MASLNYSPVQLCLKSWKTSWAARSLHTRLEAAGVTVSELVLGYEALATVIEAEAIEPVILADPDDDAVLACALAAQSEVITSGDNHLLALKQHQEIRILTAAELLAELSL